MKPGLTVYDRIDAAATINFSTQFGAATIRERRLFLSAWVHYRLKKIQWKSKQKHKDSVLVLLRAASEVIAKSFRACV